MYIKERKLCLYTRSPSCRQRSTSLASLGISMFSTLAYFISSWRHLYLLSIALFFLYCLLVLPFMSESLHWYLAQCRANNALVILKKIALKNEKTIHHQPRNRAHTHGGCICLKVSQFCHTTLVQSGNHGCLWGLDVPNLGGYISIGLILNVVGEMPTYVICAHVGAIASLVVAVLARFHGWIPFSIFFTTTLLGSYITCCWFPKSMEKPMYETIHDGMLK